MAKEQTTNAELQANFEAERNGDYIGICNFIKHDIFLMFVELAQKLNNLTGKTTTVTEEERKRIKVRMLYTCVCGQIQTVY